MDTSQIQGSMADAERTNKFGRDGQEMSEGGVRIQAVPSKIRYKAKGRSKGAKKSGIVVKRA